MKQETEEQRERRRQYHREYYLRTSKRQRMIPGHLRQSKKCMKCGIQKDRNDFTIRKMGDRIGHLVGYCRKCSVNIQRDNRRRDPSIYRRNEWPSKLKAQYGITVDDYNRMLKEQGGRCAICLTDDPRLGRPERSAFAVDHNHTTGKVRGLLCSRCNQAVGLLDDDAERATRLISYLLKEISLGHNH